MSQWIEFPPGSGRRALYEDHEVALMRELTRKCEDGEIDRAELVAQANFVHDAKMSFEGARVMTDEEQTRFLDERGELTDAPVLVPDREGEPISLFGTESFPVPEKARKKLGERDNATMLPITSGDTRSRTAEPEPEAVLDRPATTEGSRGGSVPTLGDRWLSVLLRRYSEESKAVRATILVLALKHGEYHSDMIDKAKLSQPNIVGGAVGTLVRDGKIIEVSRRMSGNEVRRAKSGVYELTPEGIATARSLADRLEDE